MRPVATIRAILVVLGGFPLFLLVMARIDSREEHLAIQVMDVVVGLMLSVAFALPSV